MIRRIANRGLAWALVLVLVSMVAGRWSTEAVGDRLQVTLPLAGFGCAIAGGQGVRYTGRFLLTTVSYRASKHGLGEAQLNARPNGGFEGFPSGHTTAAAFGAAGLARTCLSANPPAQAVVGLAAGLVGGTRIDVGAHNVWQVLAGAIWGWVLQVATLTAFDNWFRRVAAAMGRGMLRAVRAVRDGAEALGRLIR
ncbi:phosphatase PAP2 family protein [Rhodobacterales bacterium HKCCE2091]|nr:phosphatase PAP2 family protein [Rhodobacterales bacterium HKCCE2091]